MRVWLLFLPCPPLLQTRGRSPTPHAWWHCPPALLPLASGDICGGRAHCGPDHLCQEPGGQGRSHEEAQVLLTGRRILGSHARAQRLSRQVSARLPRRAHVWWRRRWKGPQPGLREAPSSVAAETGTAGRVGNLSPVSPRAVAVAKGPSS